jgi:serine/threonine-protein kinase
MLVGQHIGPFVVDKELGTGAMGAVYRAFYTKTGRDVAIKIIAIGLDTNATNLARFEREAAILKKLDHPNIVRLIGTGRYHKKPFYVMEYIEGETLEHVLERRDRFTWEEVVTLGQQVCSALKHAHDLGIVHRDLKPANIMLTPDGTAKLTDFGIAKGLENTQLTTTNCTVGTAAYMSPEQCRGERNLTLKSDLYSLGVMFYELLTGRKPFIAETTLDMFLAHTGGKFERPSRLVLDIPIWLDTLVCQQLEKDPEKRPLDAAMIGQALEMVKEKVTAQRSAGVDLVGPATAQSLVRRSAKADEEDREAARYIRAGAVRRKVQRRTKPFYERAWFVVTAALTVVAALAGVVYLALRPPAAAALYAQAHRLMKTDDYDSRVAAREGPIQQFLRYYPERDDEPAVAMRQWADQVDLEVRERQLRNMRRFEMVPEEKEWRVALRADADEDKGELTSARELWQTLLPLREQPIADDLHVFGVLAEKRLADLDAAGTLEHALQAQVEQARRGGKAEKGSNDPREPALQAVHYELFGDNARALRGWKRLKDNYPPEGAPRVWALLTAEKINQLSTKDKKDSALEVVEPKLAEAEKMQAEKPDEAVVVCRDIVVLYAGIEDADLAKAVARARKLLRQLGGEAK